MTVGETDTTVVGIDLSGVSRSTKGRTAGARLRLDGKPSLEDVRTFPPGVRTDRVLVEWIASTDPEVVAIDAPLSLPHSVSCVAEACPRCVAGEGEYVARDVDRQAGGMATVMLAAIAFRGMHIARVLRDRGLWVVETYPGAAYRRWRLVGTDRAGVLTPRVQGFHADSIDECDAVAAALVAADVAEGRAERIVGEDGEMWVPGTAGD